MSDVKYIYEALPMPEESHGEYPKTEDSSTERLLEAVNRKLDALLSASGVTYEEGRNDEDNAH